MVKLIKLINFTITFNLKSTVHLADTIAIIQGKSLNLVQVIAFTKLCYIFSVTSVFNLFARTKKKKKKKAFAVFGCLPELKR